MFDGDSRSSPENSRRERQQPKKEINREREERDEKQRKVTQKCASRKLANRLKKDGGFRKNPGGKVKEKKDVAAQTPLVG